MDTRARVLVVDDENVVRTSFDRVLSEGGYTVDTAVDGNVALDRVQKEPFDIAFVDLKMPGMSGMDVMRQIRKMQPAAQVIIVTGYGTPENQREAESLGVMDFLAKPVSPQVITGAADRAWSRRRQVREQLEKEGKIPHLSVVPTGAPAPVNEGPAAVTAATAATTADVDPAPAPSAPPAAQEAADQGSIVKLMVTGPILGLAFVIFLPVIGLGMLAYVVARAAYGAVSGTKAV